MTAMSNKEKHFIFIGNSGSDTDCEEDVKESKLVKSVHSITYLPAVAVPEKIVVCLDTTHHLTNGYAFDATDSEPICNSDHIRNEAIRVFITNKLSIATDTEFALIALQPGRVEALVPFRATIREFLNCLTAVKSLRLNETGTYDITEMFNSVFSLISVPQQPKSTAKPPAYVVRLILVYGNSFMAPTVNVNSEHYKMFKQHSSCILDVLYLHDPPSESNNVEQIFQCFGQIISENSYLLENERNVTTLFNKMAMLLAHPNQRVSQEFCKC